MISNETGIVIIGTGMAILTLGALLLFDKALVIAGHLLLLAGFIVLFRSKTFSLFRLDKLQGTCFFILGVAVLLFKYQLLGFLLEILGLLLIFKSSLPNPRSIVMNLLFRSNKTN